MPRDISDEYVEQLLEDIERRQEVTVKPGFVMVDGKAVEHPEGDGKRLLLLRLD